ncbi:hypothetical protein EGH24_07525 [Halonotius terrestris]|uniref:Uncharacterized protein n=1 Tax=Halonotius terrestris TaxID=2487750 RepID=A0A8J8TCA4_9EURY|nr:hypothetical protein [Halonotius terrestris]TQQ80993.1 hypothetical protein EGH24_07525 [Halonotius terrestris]
MKNSTNGYNVDIDDESGFSLTRRSMLGALGASATVGLAGCSGVTNQSFTAPWVGMTGETFPHPEQGDRPVTLTNDETASIVETRDAGPLGEVSATLNMKGTSYNWQLEEEYPATVGFVPIPIPILGGTEIAGPLDDPLVSLVSGEWGLELFNRMGFTDEPVDSVNYVRQDYEGSGEFRHPDFTNLIDYKVFTATATMNDESTEEYWIGLLRMRTKTEVLPDGTDDSYVFTGVGTLAENVDSFGYNPEFYVDEASDDYGIIDEP